VENISYITASAKAGTGTIVLQEASLIGGKNKQELPVIMTMIFAGQEQSQLAVEIGEWFQNKLVPMIQSEGEDGLINVCMMGLGRDDFQDRANATDYACAVIAGHECALFMNGERASICSVEELMGRRMMIPMKTGNAGIMVSLEAGGALVLMDGGFGGDGFYAKQLAEGFASVKSERELERMLQEIVNIDEVGCGAIVGILGIG